MLDKLKKYLSIAGSALLVILFAVVGMQRKRIEKQKELARKQADLIRAREEAAKKVAEAQAIKDDLRKKQEEAKKKEEKKNEEIHTTDNVEDAIDTGNSIIDDFNKRV